MSHSIRIGLTGTLEKTVRKDDTAASVKSGVLEVLGTPVLAAFMEEASCLAVQEVLPSKTTTVGTYLQLEHKAPTPVGMEVQIEAKLVETKDRLLIFELTGKDEKEAIGKGVHHRVIVDEKKFMERVNGKSKR